jgi:hypothetical protein
MLSHLHFVRFSKIFIHLQIGHVPNVGYTPWTRDLIYRNLGHALNSCLLGGSLILMNPSSSSFYRYTLTDVPEISECIWRELKFRGFPHNMGGHLTFLCGRAFTFCKSFWFFSLCMSCPQTEVLLEFGAHHLDCKLKLVPNFSNTTSKGLIYHVNNFLKLSLYVWKHLQLQKKSYFPFQGSYKNVRYLTIFCKIPKFEIILYISEGTHFWLFLDSQAHHGDHNSQPHPQVPGRATMGFITLYLSPTENFEM